MADFQGQRMTEPSIPRCSDFQAATLGGLDVPVVIFPVTRKLTFMTEAKRSHAYDHNSK